MIIKRITIKLSSIYSRIRGFVELGTLRIVSLALNFLTMPIYLHHLGVEAFGVYSVLIAIFAFGTMFDLGVSNALISAVGIAFERRETLKMKQIISNSLYALFVGTGVFSILAITLVAVIDIENVLNIPPMISQEFSSSILVTLMLIAPNSFSQVASKISLAFGRAKESAAWITVTVIITQFLSVLAVTQSKSLFYLVLAQTLTPTIIGICYFIKILALFPEIRPSFSASDSSSLKAVLKSGRLYFFLQISSVFSYHFDVIIVSMLLDNRSVSELSFTWKIASIPYLLVSASLLPFWQRSAILFANERSVEAFTLKMIRALSPILLGWSILFSIFGKEMIIFWSKGAISPSNALIFSCAIWSLMASLMAALSIVLNGIHSSKFLLFSTGSFTVVNVLISVVATKITGNSAGPIVGSSIAAVLCFFIPLAKAFRNILNQKEIG